MGVLTSESIGNSDAYLENYLFGLGSPNYQVWTLGVSVPSNGMEKIIFPRLIFFSLMIELIYAHCRKLGGL